jgi:hypothetical protein
VGLLAYRQIESQIQVFFSADYKSQPGTSRYFPLRRRKFTYYIGYVARRRKNNSSQTTD